MFNTIATKENTLANMLALMVKHYIYVNRCLQKPCSTQGFMVKVEMMRKIELYNAKKSQKCNTHYWKWHKIDKESNNLDRDSTHNMDNYIEEYLYDKIVNV